MTNRRDFLKTMLTALGAAAVAHPLTDLVADGLRCAIPAPGKLIQPPGDSFFVHTVGFFNRGLPTLTPRLLIGSWELDTGLFIHNGENIHLHFGPQGGYQLDPGETVALMGKEISVMLAGFKIPHQPLREPGDNHVISNPFVPYVYWLRV